MRPFQIILLSVFVVLALLGLLLFATFKGFGGAKSVGAVTIWGTLSADAVQPALDDLRRTHQEFTALVYSEHDAATFDSDLSDAIASGTGPDLIITTQERLNSERNKLAVIPFSSVPKSTFRESYLPIGEMYLTDTGTYGIPLAVDPLVLYYNRTRLSSANIPEVPTTWEAIVGLAPRLTLKNDAGTISKSAIALGTYENIPNARAIISLLFLQSGNKLTEAQSGALRSTLISGGDAATYGATPTESALNFYTQFADPAKIVYAWNRSLSDARQSFIAGDSAFYIGFASERPLIADSNPNLDFDMAAIPQPQTSSANSDYALAYAFAIPKASKNPAGAFQAASALASKDQAGVLVESLSMAPAMRSLLTAPASDAYAPVVHSQALISQGWLSPAPAVTDRIFAAMINNVLSGRASVHDALTTADQSLNAAL